MKREGISVVVHNTLSSMEDTPWRLRTEMLEYELAVKWFALTARIEGKPAGFMHLIRHPEREYEWYSCDVNAIDPYKRQGVATAMYREAVSLLLRYGKAWRITAAVGRHNMPSVKLHEKLGFIDTHEAPSFSGLNFGPDETVYEHCFAKEYPAVNLPMHREILAEMAGDSKDGVLDEVERSELDPSRKVFILWAGETPVGYRRAAWDEPLLLPGWQDRLEKKCLEIIHVRPVAAAAVPPQP